MAKVEALALRVLAEQLEQGKQSRLSFFRRRDGQVLLAAYARLLRKDLRDAFPAIVQLNMVCEVAAQGFFSSRTSLSRATCRKFRQLFPFIGL